MYEKLGILIADRGLNKMRFSDVHTSVHIDALGYVSHLVQRTGEGIERNAICSAPAAGKELGQPRALEPGVAGDSKTHDRRLLRVHNGAPGSVEVHPEKSGGPPFAWEQGLNSRDQTFARDGQE
jgi:hypothetical protein